MCRGAARRRTDSSRKSPWRHRFLAGVEPLERFQSTYAVHREDACTKRETTNLQKLDVFLPARWHTHWGYFAMKETISRGS